MAEFSTRQKAYALCGLLVAFAAGFGVARLTAPVSAPPSAIAEAKGVAWDLFGKLRPMGAPRPGLRKPDGFAVWDSRLDVHGTEPLACIRMTMPLDPRRSYGDFVSVNPVLGHPPAVTVSGDELCISDVGYAGRTITLLHGLPAANGQVLAENADVAFIAGAKPVYVGFAGEGVILPREDADGLGLETVNVSRLHVTVWRVLDRNLTKKRLSAPTPVAEGEYSYDEADQSVDDDGRKIWEGDLPVTASPDQRTTTVFPFGSVLKTLQSGAYVVEASDASGLKGAKPKEGETESQRPARARRWIVFTDMALQAYDGSDALDVVARSLKSAKPLTGVRLSLVAKDGEELAAASSDNSGRVHFARALLGGENGAKPARVMAYGPRGDFTLLDLERAPVDLSKQDTGGRTMPGAKPATGSDVGKTSGALDGYLYADRGIYRPGEKVHLVALVRDRLAHAVTQRSGALVIRRPSGLEFARYAFKATPSGAATADFTLPSAAPRGLWHADLQMDATEVTSGAVSFQVEDFAPQRLAVTLKAAAERPIVGGETRKIDISARFLYGAIAASLPVTAETRIAADPNPFPNYKGFVWGDQQKPFDEKLVEAPKGQTDAAGQAQTTLELSALGAPTSPLKARLTASVFEPGGRPVSEEVILPVRLRALYLGVKSTPGAGADPLQTFDVIAVDALGRRVAAPKVHYILVSERWNYDWFEQGGRWSWRRTSRDIPLAQGDLTVSASGQAHIARKLPWGDYRLVLDDPATGAHTVIRQSAGWDEPEDGVEAPDMARVSLVRETLRAGDDVAVRIQAPFAGEAQIAVAGDRLIDLKNAAVGKDGAVIHLHATRDWAGGAYVLVTIVQPRDPVSSPKPRRAVGLVYVPLDPDGGKLSVALGAPQKITSHAPVVVPLTVKGLGLGESAYVTLAAVDEGILRLTHHRNPDPISWYFSKRALGLVYRDDYGRLLDPNLGAATAVSFGADEIGGAGLANVPIRTVALWSGVVHTDASGRAVIKLPAADFNGQLRLVAVAWTEKAIGSGVANLIVREPVVAEASVPRFLAPGDHAQAMVELANVEGKPGPYHVELIGRGGPTTSGGRNFDLKVGQQIMSRFDLAAGDRPSNGSVELRTSGPAFSMSRSLPIETRPGWGAITRATTALQARGVVYTPPADLLSGLAPGDVSLNVSYSPFANFDPAPLAAALARYPFGCSEQIASTGYGALFSFNSGGGQKDRIAVANAVAKLIDRESLDGSFGYWRAGDGDAEPWVGGYVVNFLLDAKASGFPVPEEALARALNAMRVVTKADDYANIGYRMDVTTQDPTSGNKRNEKATERLRNRAAAYALYDMARYGQGDLGRLRWFHDANFDKETSPLPRALVGAGLAAMGDHGRAHDSFLQALKALKWSSNEDSFQSPLRDLAGVIALAYEAGETRLARSLQSQLESQVSNPDHLNTVEQSFLLKAARAMLSASGPASVKASGAVPQGVARWGVGKLADAHFVNTGSGDVWRTVTVHGEPLAAPGPARDGMGLEKLLYSVTGSRVDPSQIHQGQRLIVRITGTPFSRQDMTAIIDDALPAGFEIESVLSPEDAAGQKGVASGPFAFIGKLSSASVQEKRDDRYVGAVKITQGGSFTLAYIVRAVTPGDFFLPGAVAQDMYRPQVNARTAPGRIKIAPTP